MLFLALSIFHIVLSSPANSMLGADLFQEEGYLGKASDSWTDEPAWLQASWEVAAQEFLAEVVREEGVILVLVEEDMWMYFRRILKTRLEVGWPSSTVLYILPSDIFKDETISFTHHSKSAVSLRDVDVISLLKEEVGDNFVYLHADKENSERLDELDEIFKLTTTASEEKGEDSMSDEDKERKMQDVYAIMSDRILELLRQGSPRSLFVKTHIGPTEFNFVLFKPNKGDPPGIMHIDASRSGHKMLAVWVALEDIDARPLAFINSRTFLPGGPYAVKHPQHDPKNEYKIVSGMKRGQMLAFFPNTVAHVSPIMSGNDDGRKGVSFFYTLIE
jgi:hypothetical protein